MLILMRYMLCGMCKFLNNVQNLPIFESEILVTSPVAQKHVLNVDFLLFFFR